MKRDFYTETLQPADRLVIPKSSLNVAEHLAIYLDEDNKGNRMYIENAIGSGVQVVADLYHFRGGYTNIRVERFQGNQQQRNSAVQLAMKLIGKQYDLLSFNTEHYANTVQQCKTYSKLVNVVVGLGLRVLIFCIGLSKQ